MREHPTLAGLVQQQTFGLEARCQAVRSLATGVAALHLRDIALGPVSPELMAWDESSGQCFFYHHKSTPEDWTRGFLRHTPLLDEGARKRYGTREDVFYWGLVAFWVLSSGQHAYGAGPEDLRPLRRIVPDLAEGLASVIEAALAWDPLLRPDAGPELVSVLQLDGTNVVTGGAETGDKVDIHAVSSKVLAKVRTLQTSGLIPVMAAPRSRTPPSQADAMLRSDNSLVGAPEDLGRLAAEARKRGLQSVETELAPREFWPNVALVGLMLLGGATGFFLASGELPLPRWPHTPTPVASENLRGSSSSVPEVVTQAPAPIESLPEGSDPRLVTLMAHQGDVLADDFDRYWKLLKGLVDDKRLPGTHNDSGRLRRLFVRGRRDKRTAARKLQTWLEEIRIQLR